MQSQGRGNLGRATALEEVVRALGLVVLGQVATGLAHDPHGRTLDLLTTRSAQEKIVFHRRELSHVDVSLVCLGVETESRVDGPSAQTVGLGPRITPRFDLCTDIINDFLFSRLN